MNLFFVSSLVLALLSTAVLADEKLSDFTECAGRYEIVRVKNLYDPYTPAADTPTEIIVESSQFQVISPKVTRTENLETYNWSEEGYFGIAEFTKLPTGCAWSKRHNAGGQMIQIERVADNVFEINERCNWKWVCQFSFQYLVTKKAQP